MQWISTNPNGRHERGRQYNVGKLLPTFASSKRPTRGWAELRLDPGLNVSDDMQVKSLKLLGP